MSLHEILQQIVNGLDLGSIYALIAIGYTLVYGVLRLINFAHGDVFMIGSFIGLEVGERFHGGLAMALAMAMVGCAILGILIERLAYRPLRKAPRLAVLITAIGVSLLLENGGQLPWVFGATPHAYPSFIPSRTFQVGQVSIQLTSIYVWSATIIILVFLWLLVMKTKTGKAMRAVQHDQEAAALMGINVNGIITFTFALGSALAGVAGVLYACEYPSIDPLMGLMPGLKAFVAAVLGGIGSIPGAVLGGLLLGVVETAVASMGSVAPGWPSGATYRDAIAFFVLILVLLWRPTGLLGTGAVEKV